MPAISDFICNKCRFALPSGWGGYTYVQDDKGKRKVCPHPAEVVTIAEVLGLKENEIFPPRTEEIRNLLKERTGFLSTCVCLDCLEKFGLDLAKDERRCPSCKSDNVKATVKLVNQRCPRCKVGFIEEIDTGLMS
jgi:predicted Zn-ribbon and HTH transcriptional regulator